MPAPSSNSATDDALARLGRFAKDNWFVLAICLTVGLAFVAPRPAARGGSLHSELTTRLGVIVIFFLQGFTLPLEALRRGATNLRLHVLILGVTFGLLPLLGLALDATIGHDLDAALRLGLLYLCVLPSTIKTAVVFSSLAGGDAAAAVFSATASSLLGVVLTPFLLRLIGPGGAEGASTEFLFEIVELLLAPFFLGVVLARPFRETAARLKGSTNAIASCIVLFIVYAAFANSVVDGTWRKQPPSTTLVAGAIALGVFTIASLGTWWLSGRLGLGRADRITALFCAPQKTLAAGAPLARLLFPEGELGVILLPLLFYHPLQLFLGSLLVTRLARVAPSAPEAEGSPNGRRHSPKVG